MSMFSVTREMVAKLLSLLGSDTGLADGAGSKEEATFCVQQAVSLATGAPSQDDQPKHCVMQWLINFGIALNDADGWESELSKAQGLKEFAIAELGSNKLRENTFVRLFREKVKARWAEESEVALYRSELVTPDDFVTMASKQPGNAEENLKALARIAVETLKEMNSPGAAYLFMANRKEHKKPEGITGAVPRIKPATEEQRMAAWVADDTPWDSLGGSEQVSNEKVSVS
jgi:hypothetical protein